MASFKRVWIFSDLHLTGLDTPLGQAFLRALEEPSDFGDAVVLAGDIFELLVGESPRLSARFRPFFEAIGRLAARGVRISFIEGNHDFHIRGLFPGAVVFPGDEDDLRLESISGEKSLLVAHGDLADPGDQGYLRMRAVFRSAPLRFLVRMLPGRVVEAIARLLARSGDQKVQDLPEHWSDSDRNRLRSVFRACAEGYRSRGFDFVVLGHCHDLDEAGGFYWNMGYPPVHRQFLMWDSEADERKGRLFRRNFLGF
jgi:UDP-2,3-diacylglucosamine hydrolase